MYTCLMKLVIKNFFLEYTNNLILRHYNYKMRAAVLENMVLYLRSLILLLIHCLNRILFLGFASLMSIVYIVCIAKQAELSQTCSEELGAGFLEKSL